jgi:lysophospholipase L1-like esterase
LRGPIKLEDVAELFVQLLRSKFPVSAAIPNANQIRAVILMSSLAVLVSGCVQSPTEVETNLSASPRPAVSCPAPVVSQSLNGGPVRVTFAQPQASGGVLPLSFTCSPASGASFPIGLSTVACSVTDALSEAVRCNFTVRVFGPPRLSATVFLAFGDSITKGMIFDTYPGRLDAKLRQRYQTQGTSTFNDGVDGERVSPDGLNRLSPTISARRAQVLLLMEGSNDLNGGSAGATRGLDGLTEMVRLAKGRGLTVFLATIPPQRPGAQRAFTQPQVPGFNDNVRAIAQREGATLVDVYAAMIGDLSLIGPDDLHPNERGHEVIAQLFFDAIQRVLELPPE